MIYKTNEDRDPWLSVFEESFQNAHYLAGATLRTMARQKISFMDNYVCAWDT